MTFHQKLLEVAQKNIERNKDTITVEGVSVFAQQENGLYSMYLPTQVRNDWGYGDLYKLSNGIHCVVTNIEEFHLYRSNRSEGMFLLKVKTGKNTGFWMPIFPETYSWYLDAEHVKERFEDTPKIYFEGETEAIVLEEFYYLWHESYIVAIDNRNYFIRQIPMSWDEKLNIELKEFKFVKPLPIDKQQFMVKDEKGEYFYNVFGEVSFGPAATIEEIQKKDYPFLSENFHGYFLKDESNNILKIYIAKERNSNNIYSYIISLNNPAKEVKFLKRIIIEERENALPEFAAEIWGITYVNGKKDIITQIVGGELLQYNVNYSDLIY